MYWLEVLANLKEISVIMFTISLIPLLGLGTVITCEKHDLFKEAIKKEKAVFHLNPWVCKAFYTNIIISLVFFLICVFVPDKRQIVEILGPGKVIEHLRHGDVEGLSEESINYFEKWAADSTMK